MMSNNLIQALCIFRLGLRVFNERLEELGINTTYLD